MQTEGLTFLPVKHYSPAACRMVAAFLADGGYDTLFVELPAAAQSLCGALVSRDTAPPVSFLSEEDAFLPVLAYSPEYTAAKLAAEAGKRIVFIDDFGTPASLRPDARERASGFLEGALEMCGEGPEQLRERFALLGGKCAADISERERRMAGAIAAAGFTKAFAVVGGAHCGNIARALREDLALAPRAGGACWLVPYVPDDFRPYHYGFYKGLAGGSPGDFAKRASECLVAAAREAENAYSFARIPLTDIIHTIEHGTLLSAFRGKPAIGSGELLESALSIVCKGDASSVFYRCLERVLDTVDCGTVSSACDTPLLRDYRRELKRLRLPTVTGAQTELRTLTDRTHRQKSVFLKRLAYLETGFAEQTAGADYVRGTDKNRVREIWRIGNVKKAEGALVRLSHLGSTVEAVVARGVARELEETLPSDCGRMADCCLRAYFLEAEEGAALERLTESVSYVSAFPAAVHALGKLVYLAGVKKAFDGAADERLQRVAAAYYFKALRLFDPAGGGDGEATAAALAAAYGLAVGSAYLDVTLLYDAISDRAPADPIVAGAADGILVRAEGEPSYARMEKRLATENDPSAFGGYVMGCSIGNRGLLTDRRFLTAAAGYIERLPLDGFLACAPSLRFGFSRLRVRERQSVLRVIQSVYGEDEYVPTDPDLVMRDEYLARQLAVYRPKL